MVWFGHGITTRVENTIARAAPENIANVLIVKIVLDGKLYC